MKKLNSSARTTEVDSVSDQIITLYQGNAALADDVFLKGIMDEIGGESHNITEAIKRDRIFPSMEDVDVQVEKDARALKTIVKGYAAMPDESLAAAAQEVLAVIEKFNYKNVQHDVCTTIFQRGSHAAGLVCPRHQSSSRFTSGRA